MMDGGILGLDGQLHFREASPRRPMAVRAVFISDVHLGTRGSKADMLAEFLTAITCETLYLIGDIIDGWRLKRSWFWDEHHDAVVFAILRQARAGTEIVYVPGNHDEMFRRWLSLGVKLEGIRLAQDAIHITANRQKMLVTHGDAFDSVILHAKFLAQLGDQAYTVALLVNRWFNSWRRRFGYPYWSLSAWLKLQVKGAVRFIDRFEIAVAQEAKSRGLDGVICGHIHHAEMRMIGDIRYFNTGDWVETCSALVEHHDGRFELISWPAHTRPTSVA
jgi:UDP-2,3-diacylglucosamine pyrophosphatase LpxH